jgi:thiol-disulfide isomerase/thioredoxin
VWSFLIILAAIVVLWIVLRSGAKPRVILALAGVFLAALLALFLSEQRAPGPGAPTTTVGVWLEPSARPAIDMSADLKTLAGRGTSIDQFKGKVVFVNFWATWCPPCLIEMPSMARLYERFSKQGLQMVAISNEDLATVRSHVSRNPVPFTVLVDPNDTLAQRFGIQGIPTTFILDQEGRLIYQQVGANNWDSAEVRQKIEALLTQ